MPSIPARLTPDLIRALFAEALSLEFGMRLPVEAAYHDRAKTMIAVTRKTIPTSDEIMICAFPEAGELWFLKRTVEVII